PAPRSRTMLACHARVPLQLLSEDSFYTAASRLPAPPLALLEQGGDQTCRAGGGAGLHRLVLDGSAEAVEHLHGEPLGRRLVVRGRLGCAVAAQAVDDVMVLLEVVAERDVDE